MHRQAPAASLSGIRGAHLRGAFLGSQMQPAKVLSNNVIQSQHPDQLRDSLD